MRKWMAKRPEIKAKIEAMIREDSTCDKRPAWCRSKTFFKPEPKIIGKDRRKENLAATSLVSPANKPPEMVEPERDMPGTRAKH